MPDSPPHLAGSTGGRPILVIHGGAGPAASPQRAAAVAASLQAIARAGAEALQGGASALDVAVNAVRRMEDDPLFNAGTGAKLQLDGRARLSAAVMDGTRERFGGVVNVEGLLNPVLLSRALLDDDDRVLDGVGAIARARQLGLPEGDVRTAERIAAWQARVGGVLGEEGEGRHGTVGAVALDAQGGLAAATSTGGRGYEDVGRVSDTPTVAATFADTHAAVSATGIGEQIVETGLAARVAAFVAAGLPLDEASKRVLDALRRHERQAGFIALDRRGAWTVSRSTPAMSWWLAGAGHDRGFVAPGSPA